MTKELSNDVVAQIFDAAGECVKAGNASESARHSLIAKIGHAIEIGRFETKGSKTEPRIGITFSNLDDAKGAVTAIVDTILDKPDMRGMATDAENVQEVKAKNLDNYNGKAFAIKSAIKSAQAVYAAWQDTEVEGGPWLLRKSTSKGKLFLTVPRTSLIEGTPCLASEQDDVIVLDGRTILAYPEGKGTPRPYYASLAKLRKATGHGDANDKRDRTDSKNNENNKPNGTMPIARAKANEAQAEALATIDVWSDDVASLSAEDLKELIALRDQYKSLAKACDDLLNQAINANKQRKAA